MSRILASARIVSRGLPLMLALALVLGLLLPGAALAAPDGKANKPVVEQMAGRGGYYGNPWARAQPSCSSNRYYARNPRARYARVQPQPYYQQRQYRYNDDYYGHDDYDRCGGFYYRVRRGDNLSSIARYYGISYGALARANGIRNPNRIYAGQQIYIPSGGYCR